MCSWQHWTDLLQHEQTPNQTDPINQLHRAHQTAVFRLRTHHAPLNAHIHRIKKEHPAKCVYCLDSDETVEHFLFHCPLCDKIRTWLVPAQPNIGLHNTLYESTTQLQLTAAYNMSAWTDVTRMSEVWGTKKGKKGKDRNGCLCMTFPHMSFFIMLTNFMGTPYFLLSSAPG